MTLSLFNDEHKVRADSRTYDEKQCKEETPCNSNIFCKALEQAHTNR